MDAARIKRRNNARRILCPECHLFYRVVIRKHRNHGFARTGLRRSIGDDRTISLKLFRATSSPIPEVPPTTTTCEFASAIAVLPDESLG